MSNGLPRALNAVGWPAATVLGTGDEVLSVAEPAVWPNLFDSLNELASPLLLARLEPVPNAELGS